ncbi:ATP-dependent DNA helicase pif1-like [Aphidius gifuensis]|uniref:ATP-dependent DNA helicase pif1-like n=1 Tax=Aphidius gifuensis TaxID=684658 RepID=UPI001CDD438C|nr:ATP-dependent DNA helicase pif1-like [Aphidius gifuensis]
MYNLIFWVNSRSTTVIESSEVRTKDVFGKLMIQYGNRFYHARVIATNENKAWLESLEVNLNGQITGCLLHTHQEGLFQDEVQEQEQVQEIQQELVQQQEQEEILEQRQVQEEEHEEFAEEQGRENLTIKDIDLLDIETRWLNNPKEVDRRLLKAIVGTDQLRTMTLTGRNGFNPLRQENEPKLTDNQQAVYNTILQSVLQNTGKLFFPDAPGGTGKTFMLNLLLLKLRVQGIISLAVAFSGIAATLLQNGKTAHSAFKLPLNLQTTERPVCSVKKQSSLGKLLRETRFIVWDESTMANKGGPEALDRTLNDFRSDDRPMGGVVVLFAGDFRQILPVVPKGSKSDEINACLKSSYLWSSITSLRLTTNMRVHLGGDNNADLFSQTLLKIGSGTFQNDNDSTIQITSTFAISVLDQNNLINKVYPEISQLSNKSNEWLRERAILAPKNDTVNVINEKILSMFEADEKTYISFDTLSDQDDVVDIPIEFLNSLNPSGLPPHKLNLKIGAPIILMRNLNAPKLCNGTRLRIISLKKNLIEAEILTGSASG